MFIFSKYSLKKITKKNKTTCPLTKGLHHMSCTLMRKCASHVEIRLVVKRKQVRYLVGSVWARYGRDMPLDDRCHTAPMPCPYCALPLPAGTACHTIPARTAAGVGMGYTAKPYSCHTPLILLPSPVPYCQPIWEECGTEYVFSSLSPPYSFFFSGNQSNLPPKLTSTRLS